MTGEDAVTLLMWIFWGLILWRNPRGVTVFLDHILFGFTLYPFVNCELFVIRLFKGKSF